MESGLGAYKETCHYLTRIRLGCKLHLFNLKADTGVIELLIRGIATLNWTLSRKK